MSRKKSDAVKVVEKSDSEKRAVSALRTAEQKRKVRESLTLGVYAPRLKGSKIFGLPFFATSDSVASAAYRSCIDMESKDDVSLLGSDLFFVGTYCGLDAMIKPAKPRFISY